MFVPKTHYSVANLGAMRVMRGDPFSFDCSSYFRTYSKVQRPVIEKERGTMETNTQINKYTQLEKDKRQNRATYSITKNFVSTIATAVYPYIHEYI
jgi:hypothetical protein